MQNILKFIFISIFLSISCLTTSAYELDQADKNIVSVLETKIFEFIDSKGGQTGGLLLDKLDKIQMQNRSERVVAILEALESSIESRYDIGKYVTASVNTPVLYTSDFNAQFGGANGISLNFDRFGEIDAVEYVAFPGTVFSVEQVLRNGIYKVTTKNYPASGDLYIHKSFVSEIQRTKTKARTATLPSKAKILERLRSIDGADYVWGGNSPEGIPELLNLYKPQGKISAQQEKDWQLTGVDCSGLIYWATDGYTSRNTSWLVEDDTRLNIAGKNLSQITSMLKPLDIIVWKGHMMVVLDEEHTIESAVSFTDVSLKGGVQIRKISDSLGQVMQSKTPVNNYGDVAGAQFVVLRWYEGE